MISFEPQLKKMLENNAMALATVDAIGNPHVIAMAGVVFVSNNQFLLTDNHLQETLKNINNNPNIAITIWNEDWQTDCVGYKLKGQAEYFTEGKHYQLVKDLPENQGEPCKGVLLITIDQARRLAC